MFAHATGSPARSPSNTMLSARSMHEANVVEIGALAVEEVGLGGPAGAAGVAPVGRFDQGHHRGSIRQRRAPDLHRPHHKSVADLPARVARVIGTRR